MVIESENDTKDSRSLALSLLLATASLPFQFVHLNSQISPKASSLWKIFFN